MSDALYDPTDHYVSRKRLEAMLDRESARLVEQLGARRGGRTAFFVFADTVAARSYSRYATCPAGGWNTGRLFRNAVKLYVYPYKDPSSGEIVTADTIRFPSPLQHLHALLLESHRVEPLRRYREDLLDIRTSDVIARIRAGDPTWRSSVPPPIVEIIERRSLFGHPRDGTGRDADEEQMREASVSGEPLRPKR